MTPTEKQKCIAEQAVYGDLYVMCKDNKDNDIQRLVSMDSLALNGDMPLIIIAKQNYLAHHPILRPLSDLTKEITHKGYNENQPFIPLVELAKSISNEKWELKFDASGNGFVKYVDNIVGIEFRFGMVSHNTYCEFMFNGKSLDEYRPTFHYLFSSADVYDLLRLWHFDTRCLLGKGEAIDANSLRTNNPYEV